MHIPRAIPLTTTLALAGLAGCGGAGDHGGTHPGPATAAPAAALVEVPQLIGRRQADAHRLLARAGLRMRWTGFTGKAANGRYNIGCVKVLRQSPVAGERRPRGASIAVIEAACRTPHQFPHGVAG
jgi:hypothetical protein